MKKIICISGELGSGKSMAGRIVASALGYEYFSAGMIFRQLAEKTGMNVLEFNNRSETDLSIDDMIDSGLIIIGMEKEMIILDSRMAWHFAGDSFKVYLTVEPAEAARRVMGAARGSAENYENEKEAMEGLRKRREAEAKRYLNKYKVDICNLNNYHLIIDTTTKFPEQVAALIIEGYEAYLKNHP